MEEAPGASKDDKTRTAAWRSGALIVTERIRPVLEAALAASDDSGSENQRSGLQRQVRGEVEHVLSCLKEREESERSQSEPPAAQGGDLPGIRAATLMQCCQVVRSMAGSKDSVDGSKSHGPFFHEIIRGSELVVPSQLKPKARVRSKELEERLSKLREEQCEREYQTWTASLDPRSKLREAPFAEWKLPMAFGGSVILTMFGLFAFGFQTGKAVSNGNDIVAALFAVLFSTAGLVVETILFGIRDHRNSSSSSATRGRIDRNTYHTQHLKTS